MRSGGLLLDLSILWNIGANTRKINRGNGAEMIEPITGRQREKRLYRVWCGLRQFGRLNANRGHGFNGGHIDLSGREGVLKRDFQYFVFLCACILLLAMIAYALLSGEIFVIQKTTLNPDPDWWVSRSEQPSEYWTQIGLQAFLAWMAWLFSRSN